ncbi:MAG: DUF1905 domain-containing protein [Bacteroidetes bacterium]|nr:DUF1905 domain-containing protein [Bacteroidota bacterium]
MDPIKFKTHIGLLTHLSGMHYLYIPAEIIEKTGGKMVKRLICVVNGKERWQCGFMALGEGAAYISISNQRMKKLHVQKGDLVDVILEEDISKYGMEMPVELEQVLLSDAEGEKRFELLTPGKKRYIIQYVNSVKNQDKRIERALLLIGNLKQLPLGKEHFRDMLGK